MAAVFRFAGMASGLRLWARGRLVHPAGVQTEYCRMSTTYRLALAAAVAALASPALAHHPMGGTLVDTFGLGLLSGLGHPMLGLDHLAALVGVGLLAWRFGDRGLLLPVAWLAAMGAGAFLHMQSVDLPAAEIVIAASVVAIGVVGVVRPDAPFAWLASLFQLAGLFHGHALAESIIGAETGPLVGYLIGLVAVQSVVMVGSMLAVRWAVSRRALAPAQLRLASAAVAAVGLVFVGSASFGA